MRLGRYELEAEVGRGATSTVFVALDTRLQRRVVLKVLDPRLVADDATRRRFEREAQTMAALDHPAIVTVHDVGEDDGQVYIVMRMMKGGTLEDKIRSGPLDLMDAIVVIERVATALDAAHARGVVHRDIKPANVLFDEAGMAYLADFGIARLSAATLNLTGENALLGTPYFMSPEQVKGGAVGAASDVYALGAVAYYTATGVRPFDGADAVSVMMRRLAELPEPPRQILPTMSESASDAILKALAIDPADRFPSAGASRRHCAMPPRPPRRRCFPH